MFVARTANSELPVEASNASKSITYVCRKCEEAVVFAKGAKRRAHFKHKVGSECTFGGETWQHLEAKTTILNSLRSRGLEAYPEVDVLSIEGDRRADVLAFAPQSEPPKPDAKRRMAFEVQFSTIECENLAARTNAYMTEGVPVLWIPIIEAQKFKNVFRESQTNLFKIPEYSIPFWISEIEKLHGHLWIYVPACKAFWKGWTLPDWRWKEYREGYDSEGNSHSSGDYWYQAARTRDLFLEGPYNFAQLKIVRINHKKNKRIKFVGAKFLVDLIPPGSEKNSLSRAEKRKHPHIVDGRDTGHHTWADWIDVGGEWRKAELSQVEVLPSSSQQADN